jgi:hypothetical protein
MRQGTTKEECSGSGSEGSATRALARTVRRCNRGSPSSATIARYDGRNRKKSIESSGKEVHRAAETKMATISRMPMNGKVPTNGNNGSVRRNDQSSALERSNFNRK